MRSLPLFTQTPLRAQPSDTIPLILYQLNNGIPINHRQLSQIMTETLGADDASGQWDWGTAHDAAEAALATLLIKRSRKILPRSASQSSILNRLDALEQQLPTRTRRSDETQALQQFSTPLPLAYLVAKAAAMTSNDSVLEPSCGTGLMACFAKLRGAELCLNEISKTRVSLLKAVFPTTKIHQFDAESIHDKLPHTIKPSVVIMNPPFTHTINSERASQKTTFRHIKSALDRLQEGGRLVVITLDSFNPSNQKWAKYFGTFENTASLIFSVGIKMRAFAKHGTAVAVRLHVFDKVTNVSTNRTISDQSVDSLHSLANLLNNCLPNRQKLRPQRQSPALLEVLAQTPNHNSRPGNRKVHSAFDAAGLGPIERISYNQQQWRPDAIGAEGSIYEEYAAQLLAIPHAKDHPAALVQSAAMASVTPPKPHAKPRLPLRLIESGALSHAQLEVTIYAEQAHQQFIDGQYVYDQTNDILKPALNQTEATPFRKGIFIGDGAGVGKGREVASIILSNFVAGRTKAVWITDNAPLLEDAERDWTALGGKKSDLIHLNKYKPADKVDASTGILFLTYATLRSEGRNNNRSRLDQIIEWLGAEYEGVIVFDEAHAMANAAGQKTKRGVKRGSKQGRTGLRLQRLVPNARVVYASATGATVVNNLSYAERLGLWLDKDFPFATREDFIGQMLDGGVAALEVVARDLKALGLYFARSLSFHGVEIDLAEHTLTQEQKDIYNLYADAWQVIHTNLENALLAAKISDPETTYNASARNAAYSALESNKQRFFNQLLTSMKTPTLIREIKNDLAEGRAPVVQLVSTSEALLKRRLEKIPVSEWNDLSVDITPREYIMDYLFNAFPVQAHEIFTNADGEEESRPLYDAEGNIVFSQTALNLRNTLIERLSTLPPIQSALDQLIFTFGHDKVAEVTGRNLRLIKSGDAVKAVRRPANSNITETAAFQNGTKSILVFSRAGSTGRSCHADADANNQGRRVHYLLEAGWIAANAIQGLGRTNRSNQTSKPIVRPVTTNVKGERRFISTICKRLDTLGALTKGQRETGGQGLFKPEDNLESSYAKNALAAFYQALYNGQIQSCSLTDFQTMTGLKLLCKESGSLLERLPPLTRFLNRLLALRLEIQDQLFDVFEDLLSIEIQSAKENNTFEKGVETIRGDMLEIVHTEKLFNHACGTKTNAHKIRRTSKTLPIPLEEVLAFADADAVFLHDSVTNSFAIKTYSHSLTDQEGRPVQYYSLQQPHQRRTRAETAIARQSWVPVDLEQFSKGWTDECKRRTHQVDHFWLVTGLLLPIWDKLGQHPRIWRMQADCGTRLLGRYMTEREMQQLSSRMALKLDTKISSDELLSYVLKEVCVARLGHSLTLRRSLVAYSYRVEVSGFTYDILQLLKGLGVFTEYHQGNLRAFIPADAEGVAVIDRLLAFAPLENIL